MAATLSAARSAVQAVHVLRDLTAGATPSAAQRVALERFPGWGAASPLFDPQPSRSWAALADELDDLDHAAMKAAARVVDTSFYTPPRLVEHIYCLLQQAGFRGGDVLDLGCGNGRFLQHTPADLPIAFTGVEVDPVAARIAAVLHPDATIINDRLQRVSLPNNRFDAAVGNVPFSSSNVTDSVIAFYGPLHEYFLVRAVRAVRPGGYVVMVTSRHTLDSETGLSHAIRAQADLMAAIRLPAGYFAAGGTDVVADVLVLRVREDDEPRRGWDSRQPREYLTGTDSRGRSITARVSAWWSTHPDLVAGTMRLTGVYQNPLTVDSDSPDAAVADAFAAAQPLLLPSPAADRQAAQVFSDVALTDADGRKEGSFHLVDTVMTRVVDGQLQAVSRPSKELHALVALRDTAVTLITAEADWDTADATLAPLRSACCDAYLAYVERFGALNRGTLIEGKTDPDTGLPKLSWRVPPMGGFRGDPDSALVFALEKFDQATGEASPAAILQRRVNRRPVSVTRANTPGEALAITLGEGRGLDLARVTELLSLPSTEAAFTALGDLAYRDPVTGKAHTARDYLCGNVRIKLQEALAAAATDASYERNVTALQHVQPRWLGRDEVRIELRSPWAEPGDIEDFCREVFGASWVKVHHVAPLAAWEVDGNAHAISPDAKITYTTTRKSAFDLLQAGLNSTSPTVYDEVYDSATGTTRRVRNADQTEAARAALAAIEQRFSLWIWESPHRQQRILDRYNHAMNSHVLRRDDGSYLTFPGLADDLQLWSWQRDFVDRALSIPVAFAAHSVGLGKTRTAIALCMTLRQFGIANRPLYIVPNHLIEQAQREALQTAPAGKILVVTREDLSRYGRRLFAARCATGDWDMVIMTHETFYSMPVPAEMERAWLDEQLAELEDYSRSQGVTGKRIATAVRSLEGRIERLRDVGADPDVITFDMLGIDYLAVDEADRFRRLPIATRAEGFSLGASKRATDLLLKLSMLRRANSSRPCASMFTGTPYTNTLAEAYVWQRFCDPDRLADSGLGHFDAWAAQFVRYETLVEVSPDGSGFRTRRRPAVIQNVPELRLMIGSFMSMVRTSMTNLPLPTPHQHTIVVAPTQNTRAFMTDLVKRADDLRAGRVRPDTDNMLAICGDGRKVALDPNLVGFTETAPKLEAVADNVAAIYHRTRDAAYSNSRLPGAFQLVLCDLGTPHPSDTQSYGRIRDALITRDVPADRIRFIHEATNSKAREALFAACRDGRVSVLLGSTPKVGVGTNIQNRLTALHHVDPTWTARDWDQRNGRGVRTGNLHADIDIYSYAVEGSFDAYMFQLAERKSRGFEQLYRTDSDVREIADLGGEGTLSFGELKAAAAGNTLLLRQHELQVMVRKLHLTHLTARQNVNAALHTATEAEHRADALQARAERLAELVEYRHQLAPVDLSRAAEQAVSGQGHHARWSSGPLLVKIVEDHGDHHLRVSFGYRTLWTQRLPAKVRRRGAQAVAAWSHGMVSAWLDGAAVEHAETVGRVEDSRRQAKRSREAAAGTDLSAPEELIAAEAELAEVTSRIQDEILDVAAAPRRGNEAA
ncbi:methyltransferase domain-containing protein [Mycobacterium simiae]|uniref:Methyltransferase domain-containing protein n=1 Tax=Mycobacterium simiae TaxID=1784 RepID=A0A5B1BQL3_MYCSI|nr:methyltransferase domain-containing protein [Mycobacterium simiae]KAA1250331.1 methyltransferase domain-containing protein [Mycobacterium simiae]